MAIRYHRYRELLENNREWVRSRLAEDPGFFRELDAGQRPPFLLVGCADSRKPLDTLTQTRPGELFVLRNVANQIRQDDAGMRAGIEFAVDVLGVRHLIVCGHTRCGGVRAALDGPSGGTVADWISPIRQLAREEAEELSGIEDLDGRAIRLAEISALAQVRNALRIPAVERAVFGDRGLRVHAWIFRVGTGLIQELPLPVERWREEGLLPEGYPPSEG